MDGNEVVRVLNGLQSLDRIQYLAVAAVPLVFAITLHEVAHGWVARLRGDRTAEMLGRLSLNPVRHIDPVGTLLVPGVMLLMTGFIFGWAKPVPITVENLKGKRRDMAVVGAAGPAANLLMAIVWMVLMGAAQLLYGAAPEVARFLFFAGVAGVFLNVILALLNMLPIPPLDGSRVVSALLPGRMSWQYERLEPYGIWIVLGLLMLGVLGKILWPAVLWVCGVYFALVV